MERRVAVEKSKGKVRSVCRTHVNPWRIPAMQPHLVSRTQKPRAKIAILLALFVLLAHLASRGWGPDGPSIHSECIGFFWWVTFDPQSVESFQLDLQFDPSLVSFSELAYVSPYVQT